MADLRGYRAVITAGGIGTRLLPFSKEIPKEMCPILVNDSNGSTQVKPIIHAVFDQLYRAGVREYFIVVGRGKRAIEEHFTPDMDFVDSLERTGKKVNGLRDFYKMLDLSNITFVNQPRPRGFGDAVLRVKPYLSDKFLVHAGDTLVLSKNDEHLERLKLVHTQNVSDATILLKDMDDPRQFGVVIGQPRADGSVKIFRVVEKPKVPPSKTAIMPIYIFRHSIFKHLSKVKTDNKGEIQLTDAIQSLIYVGKKVVGVKMSGDDFWLDIGSPETFLQTLKLSAEYVRK